MTAADLLINDTVTIGLPQLNLLFAALHERGYRLIGPTARNGSIVYDDLASTADLPAGWIDDQNAGSYRAEECGQAALFGFTVGQTSWKRFLYPPALRLLDARHGENGFDICGAATESGALAFVGVRPCDLHAIAILDRVLAGDRFLDPNYHARRTNTIVIVVQCGRAGGHSFTPGQFNMLYLFGVGEIPISISGDPNESTKLVHTTRAVGTVTRAMQKLKRGSYLGVRGPYGTGWPLEQKTSSLSNRFEATGLSRDDILRAFRIFNAYADAFRKESEAHEK